ncbi:MAG: hypothetical protein H3C26_03685 [Rhodocyclaceae bacterium]|nr:hypothetical protein [Rhodocyclaceae bacterium]
MEAIIGNASAAKAGGNALVLGKLKELYMEAFAHDGFAELRVEMRILRRGQKEVILHCGKQYRFVVDYLPQAN